MAGETQESKPSAATTGPDDGRRGERAQEPDAHLESGSISISTDDPIVANSAAPKESPEQVIRYQTSHVQAPPVAYPFESGGDVVREDRGRGGKHERHAEGTGRENPNRESQGDIKQNHGKQGRGKPHRERSREHNREPHREHDHAQPAWKMMLLTAVVAFVCGIGGAWAYAAFFGASESDQKQEGMAKDKQSDKSGKSGGKSSDKQSKSAGDKSQGSGGASAEEIPGFSSANDSETFKKELEHLAHRLDLLGGRIDRITTNEDETPPALHTMQRKMTDLERELFDVARLPSKISTLEQQLSNLRQELKMLSDRVSGNETPLTGDLAPPNASSADSSPPPATDADPADEATLHLAGGLLREGHYSQSYQVLRRLQRARPRDARVWYLSALAHGLSNGKWDEQAKRLAAHGAECERAGTPSRHDIDDALAGLTSGAGKDWIASQRLSARTR